MTSRSAEAAGELARDGCTRLSNFASPAEREELASALGEALAPGRRDALTVPAVARWATSERVRAALRPWLPIEPRPVRALFFNKSPEVNWLVPWHQDLTIAVRERVETPGFGPWSVKEGVPHVQPPTTLLERMLAIRLHLDDVDESNGVLQVVRGSHRLGRLSAERIGELRSGDAVASCFASAGDAWLMRPLLLHASARSTSDRPRRVLHVEYAGFELPAGLAWRFDA